jgi:hypothetical protein
MTLRGWFPMVGVSRRTGFGLLGILAVVFIAAAVMLLADREQPVTDRGQLEAQREAFANFSATHHTIDRIDFFGWNADSGSAGIVMRGNRAGDYRISWQVTESAHNEVLAQGRTIVSLGPGRRTVVVPLARNEIVEAYREKVLKGAGRALVDETFRLAVTVAPVLSPKEIAILPPREVENLAAGHSSLHSYVGIDLSISFEVPAAPAVQTD